MLTVQRVIYDTTDISTVVNDYRGAGYALSYVPGKYLYIGGELPFTALWWEMAVANAVAGVATVEIWWGQQWHAAVDLVDETIVAAGWDRAQLSSWIPSFPNGNIYHFYWTRWSWNTAVAGTVKYIGQKFSADRDMFAFYPDLNNTSLMTAFGGAADPSKATWSEQAFMAAEIMFRDLVGRKIIYSRGQLVDWSRLNEASVHKTAELIYRGLGPNQDANRAEARRSYHEAMNYDFFRVDANADGKLEPEDKFQSCSYMTR